MDSFKSSTFGKLLLLVLFTSPKIIMLKMFDLVSCLILFSPVQVCYYRYIKFFPSGRFLYKVLWSSLLVLLTCTNPVFVCVVFRMTANRFLFLNGQNSSQKLKDVAKFMNFRASKAESIYRGQYTLTDDKVYNLSVSCRWPSFGLIARYVS